MPTLIQGGTLLTMAPSWRPARGDVLVSGRRITGVGTVEAPPGSEVLDASGCYVMPGLVQLHLHLVQTLCRGLAEDLPLLDWLRRRIWPLEAALDEASMRASVRLGLLELELTGTTTVLDMGTSHGGDVVAEELVRSGIRARFGQAMMDAGEGVPPRLLETTRASLDASGELKKRWDGQDGGRIGYAYAPRFALSCTRELLEAVTALSKMTSTLVHTHSNEDAAERAAIEAATGRAPAAYLAERGIASERAVFAHGVHLDDAELAILAATGTAVAHCPSSNLKLGAGIADVARLRAARVTVGLGADGAACNNRLDGFEEARLATLLARTKAPLGALTAAQALEMATREGAKAMHVDDEVGTLQAGKRADLVVIDAERLALGGEPATRILFGGGSRAVRDVMIDGQLVVRDGRSLRFDEAEVRAKAAEAVPALLERAGT
ncbi:MAG TPA: amidohydrolase family protein [Candidatus Limnocylindrales bacterium]|nr:amidohydrolase family protein [Candidatus Limnocylindrales bacterium]